MSRPSLITIVGPGAVGQMLAFFLRSVAPLDVRGRHGRTEIQASVLFKGRKESIRIAKGKGSAKLWIFATKAYDLEAALLATLPEMEAGAVIVLLANGYIESIIAPLRGRYPHLIWRKGLVLRGCRFLDEGSLALSDAGDVIWGDSGEPTPLEKEIFQKLSGDHFRWDSDACTRRREKWIFNTVLNTLSGAYGLARNGLALDHPDFLPLGREVFALAHELWPDWTFRDDDMLRELRRVIDLTKENENSMARDRRLGRPVEADFLSGYVLSVPNGQRDYPRLWSLHHQLSAKADRIEPRHF